MMQWERLLSLQKNGVEERRIRKHEDPTRLGFEKDYDRLIFSSAFRSLQDKTQVIPLSQKSFVHTRLTHSLEVSVVGRSLGRIVGQRILKSHPHLEKELGYTFNDFGSIVAAASLAHDIGNPPFGHSGERAMGDYFKSGNGVRFKDKISEKEYADLIDFEGNANGFKILTESRDGSEGGLRLTFATLGAFMKYPKESLPKRPSTHVADKKYGVFQNDILAFRELVADLGLLERGEGSYARHPLAYLVEAADDICYTIIDFEDGINLGWIPEDMALEYLVKLVKNNLRTEIYSKLSTRKKRVAYLRSIAINTLIEEVTRIFVENEVAILQGNFPKSLMDDSSFYAQTKDIIKVSVDNIYRSVEVREKEIAGYRILTTVLDAFVGALENYHEGKERDYDMLLLRLMNFDEDKHLSVYQYLLEACSYVSQLTDGNAVQIFNKINGHL